MSSRIESNKSSEYPVWKMLSPGQLAVMYIKLKKFLRNNVHHVRINFEDITWNRKLLFHIFDMVKKRELYFHIYHNGMVMGEVNEMCLYVFWILKLRPFSSKSNPNMDVNFLIAVLFYVNAINTNLRLNRKDTPEKLKSIFTSSNSEHITHAFKFQDLSKEAIMLLAHTSIGDY